MNKDALFLKEYERLNPEQKKAVDAIYGPVLVLAGPGTGKTQILSMRIANLLRSEAQVQPQNILCLTFTDEGQKNMRDRLFKLVGPQIARHINVHTYHSFCSEVIQNNLHHFKKDNLELVSELEELKYMTDLVKRMPKENLFYNPKKPTKSIGYLKNLFRKIKQEGWTSHELIQRTERHLEEFKNDPANISTRGKTKGQLKSDAKPKVKAFEKTIQGAKVYNEYQKILLEHNRYEFADMILWVIDLLKKDESVLFDLQERFQFLLVDEMQDTNGTQLELVNLLSNYDPSPNVFVVGDDDQAIYRFQGANLANLSEYRAKYIEHGLTEVSLKTNYRSYQGILDKATELIHNNKQRLIYEMKGLSKDLESFQTQDTKLNSQPIILQHHNPHYEFAFIANKIKALIDSGVPHNEIAVLFTKNAECTTLGEYLNKLEISFYTKASTSLLHYVFTKQVLSILKYLELENRFPYSEDDLLFEILHFDLFGIAAQDVSKLYIDCYNFNRGKKKVNRKSLRQFVIEEKDGESYTLFNQSANKILDAVMLLEHLIKAKANNSLYRLMDIVSHKLKLVDYILKSDDKFEKLELLNSIYDLIKDESERRPDVTLEVFLENVKAFEENDVKLNYTKVFGNEKSVQLYTYHGAKGREYEHVFLAGCIESQWEKKKKGGQYSVKIPPNINQVTTDENDMEELRRLFFVGLTRAKKQVYVSYYKLNEKGKPQSPTAFVNELYGENQKEFEEATIKNDMSREDLIPFASLYVENTEVKLAQLEKEYVDRQLEKFSMNVSALNSYLDCPIGFYIKSILRAPSGKNESMTFGSVIHDTLEDFFVQMQANGQNFPSKQELHKMLEHQMYAQRAKFSTEGYQLKKGYGEQILTGLYDKFIDTWCKDVKLEEHISAVVDGVKIKGFIDKVEEHTHDIQFIDYKTGDRNGDYAKKKLRRPNPKAKVKATIIGGDYWRQAVFYKILADESKKYLKPVHKAKYVFVEPDQETKEIPEAVEFTITPEDISIVKKQIIETNERIMAHDFYTGCGKEDCRHCEFMKDTNQDISVMELQEDSSL
jgi:DNA helicase-2/ATP-dependent DNA helicase PcrA